MINFTESDIITMDGYLGIAENNKGKICYIKSDYLKNGKKHFNWRGNIHPSNILRNAIIGHSDYSIDDIDVEGFDIVFCVNKNTTRPNVHGLPLGIPNDCDDLEHLKIIGDKKSLVKISKENIERSNLAYINFSAQTNIKERSEVLDLFSELKWVKKRGTDISEEGRLSYLRDMKSSKFCFCPSGNGIDTHRMWESLYMGCVPIVKKHTSHDFCSDLPVLFIDEWGQVNEGFLKAKWEDFSNINWNYEKLRISYWETIIENTLNK
jgi:hypothetical protein